MDKTKVDKKSLKNRLKELSITAKDLLESNKLGEVYIMLSLRCNLRCRVCAWWGIKGPCRNRGFMKAHSASLSLNVLKRFADEIVAFKPTTVTFSGGEPLLFGRWHSFARYLKEQKVKISLTTNGACVINNFAKIVEVVDEINLSLGGPPSIIPLIRENSLSHFTKIMRGLKKLDVYRKANSNRPNLRILYTISDLSYGHMNELVLFMKKNKIAVDRYCFQHLMFIDKRTFNLQKKIFSDKFKIKSLNIWKGYTYSPGKIDFSNFRKEIEGLTRYSNVSFNPNLLAGELENYYKYNRGGVNYANYCTAPWHQIDMLPNGDIYLCHDYCIGNIKENSFASIWNGDKVKILRKHLTAALFPGCKGCFYHYCDRNI